jgi:hypothetical protein
VYGHPHTGATRAALRSRAPMRAALSTDALVIPGRFSGPPQSPNGGVACGVVACFVDGPAEVALRASPPLDTPLGG